MGARLSRRSEDRHGDQLALTAWSAEPFGCGERKRDAVLVNRQCEMHLAFALQPLAGDALEPRVIAFERLVYQLVLAVVEAGLGKAHAPAKLAEEPDVV